MSKTWMKLHHEILEDGKMGCLPDRAWRRCIELFLLANRFDRGGLLPPLHDICWVLHAKEDELLEDLQSLERANIVKSVQGSKGEWFVNNLQKRQDEMIAESTKRVRAFRAKKEKSVSETLQKRDETTDLDRDLDLDKSTNVLSPKCETVEKFFDDFERFFPDKPKPRRTTSQRKKVVTRLRDKDFRDNYLKALSVSSESPTLQSEKWFNLNFVIKNDENYTKMLDGWMDWKDRELKNQNAGKFHSQIPSKNIAKDIPREQWGAH